MKGSCVNLKTKWDLDNVFSQYFKDFNYKEYLKLYEQEFEKLLRLTKFSFKDEPKNVIKNIKKFLFAYNKFLEVYSDGGPGFAYLWLKYRLNQNDQNIKKEYKQIEFKLINLSAKLEPFFTRLSKIPKRLQNLLLQDSELLPYNYWLKTLFENGKYNLGTKIEVLLTKLYAPLFSNWASLTGQVLIKNIVKVRSSKFDKKLLLQKLPFLSKKELTKVCIRVPFTALRNFYTLPASKNKIVTYIDKKLLDISAKYADFAVTELNSISQAKGILLKERGYKDFYNAIAIKDEVSEKAIKSLQEVVTDNFTLSQNYYKCFSKITGIKLHYGLRAIQLDLKYTQKLNIIGDAGSVDNSNEASNKLKLPQVTFKQAVDIVSSILYKLSSPVYKFFNEMVNGHIDVFPKVGKSGGAFSVSFSKRAPIFILLNWGDSLNNLFTLAHEFGHSLHSYLANQYQNALNSDYSLAIAEFASTFLENLVMLELLQNIDMLSTGRKGLNTSQKNFIKASLMLNFIKDSIATIFRQIALFNFEMEFHNKVLKTGYVGLNDINNMFVKHMSAYLGPAVKFKNYHKYGWIAWSHLRRPFYVYTYAFGLLAGLNLLQKYNDSHTIKQKQQVFNKYAEILKAGSSDSVVNIFKQQGLNVESKVFWQHGINFINEQFKALCV